MDRKQIKAFQRSILSRRIFRLARLFGDMASKTLLASIGVVGVGTFFTIVTFI